MQEAHDLRFEEDWRKNCLESSDRLIGESFLCFISKPFLISALIKQLIETAFLGLLRSWRTNLNTQMSYAQEMKHHTRRKDGHN